jgi:membrane protein
VGSGIWSLVARVARRVREDDVGGLAAELAFRFFLALFPFVLVLGAAGGAAAAALGVGDPAALVGDLAAEALPAEAAAVVRPHLEQVLAARYRALLPLGFVGALGAATAGTHAVVKALNRVHRVEETRARGHRYVVALGLTAAATGLLATALVLVLLGQALAARLLGGGAAATVLGLVRWPAVIALLAAAAALVYWAAPNAQRPFRWASAGAVVFAVGWTGATLVFSAYMRTLSHHHATYGALGGVAVALLWFYAAGWLLLLGAEADVALAEATTPDRAAGRRRAQRAEASRRDRGPRPPRAA